MREVGLYPPQGSPFTREAKGDETEAKDESETSK